MSILGKLAWLGFGVGSVVEVVNNQKIKNESLEDAKRRGKDWYIDGSTGKMYLVETEQEIYYTGNDLGEKELRYKTGGLYKNLSLEESKEDAKKYGYGYYRQKVARFKNRGYYTFELTTGRRYELMYNRKRYLNKEKSVGCSNVYDYVIYFTLHYYLPHQEWPYDCCKNPPARQVTAEEFLTLSTKTLTLTEISGWDDYVKRVGYDKANIGFNDHEGEECI